MYREVGCHGCDQVLYTMNPNDAVLWVNGRFVSEHEPVICATDAGLLWGWGAFETLRMRAGKPVHAERHVRRLADAVLRLRIQSVSEWLNILPIVSCALADRVGLSESIARWTVTAGVAGRPSVICQMRPLPQDLIERQQGIEGISVPVLRGLANLKSTSYLPSLYARWALDSANAGSPQEPIFVDDSIVLEGATTNLILLGEREVHTPPADGKILPGVMREVCLEQAIQRGCIVRESTVTLSMVRSARGCYLTNSIIGVCPMVSLNGEKLMTTTWPFGDVWC